MAKQIVWTAIAQSDRQQLFEYWNNRNKSSIYSKKLNALFISSLNLIAIKPYIGRRTSMNNVRVKVVKDYFLFYEFTEKANCCINHLGLSPEPTKTFLYH